MSAVRDSDEEFVCVARDITDELRIESYRDTRERLAAELARMTRPDAPVLRSVLRIVIEGMGWDLGHVWLAEGDALRCVATWHSPALPGAEELERYVLQARVHRGEGLTGRVWATGAVEWLADINDAAAPLTDSQRAVRAGPGRAVAAAVSLPIVGADGEAPLGVLQLFAQQPRPPEPELLELLESVAATFGRQLERVRTAQELRFARDEAEAADRAKTELVSRISHELRTPLNAILGFAQLLDRDELTERQRAQTEQIASGGRHLVAMIDDLIDLSRIETGELRVSLESVSVTALLREVVELIRPLVDERGLELEVDAHGGLHEHVRADYQRLRQVLLNLLSNAVKYNRPGGRISLFFEDPGDGRLRFAVRDTGAGIAQRDLPLLFQAFERLGAERGRRAGHRARARRVARPRRGDGWPAAGGQRGRRRHHVPRRARPGRRRRRRASRRRTRAGDAVVAGRRAIRRRRSSTSRTTRPTCSSCGTSSRRGPGLELLVATRGAAGLELARRRRPDLVLLDMNLPDLSGEDVLAALKTDAATSAIPVLVLSADATPERRRLLIDQGAAGYLAKPLDVGEFVAAVRACCPASAARGDVGGRPGAARRGGRRKAHRGRRRASNVGLCPLAVDDRRSTWPPLGALFPAPTALRGARTRFDVARPPSRRRPPRARRAWRPSGRACPPGTRPARRANRRRRASACRARARRRSRTPKCFDSTAATALTFIAPKPGSAPRRARRSSADAASVQTRSACPS